MSITVMAMTIIVPRSGWSRISSDTDPTTRAMGTPHTMGSCRYFMFLDRIDATATTTTNFANSDGWREKARRSIHRADPPATVPIDRTSTSSTRVTASSGSHAFCHTW